MLGITDLEQLSFLPNLSTTETTNSWEQQQRPAIPALEELSQGQVGSLLKASLVYRVNSRPVRDT